jgi:drug/metabolite transporter (DMT)-like permease
VPVVADVAYLPGRDAPSEPRPLLGYAMVVAAATLWAVNGTVLKIILHSGPSTWEVAQLRVTGAALVLVTVLALFRRDLLRVTWRELPLLALFGIAGLTFVQLFYLEAIRRLPIGVALLVQYLAPILVALYARFFAHQLVRSRMWAALALSLGGLALVLRVWSGVTLSEVGLGAALAAALAFTLYILVAERAVAHRHPVSVLVFGLLFATLFWAVVQPLWAFPYGRLTDSVSLEGHLAGTDLPVVLLASFMIVLGTVVPFALLVTALRHVSATSAGLVAMLEPVVATIVAHFWLGETLATVQLAGGLVVLLAIGLAQTAR